MNGIVLRKFVLSLFLSGLLSAVVPVDAAQAQGQPKHRVVIQVSSDDPQTQNMVLANAANLKNYYGADNVVVEIVAYGPGLGLVTKESDRAERIGKLAQEDVHFSACGNTIKQVTKTKGEAPQLLPGVDVVPAGIARIMELQEQGYSYVRP